MIAKVLIPNKLPGKQRVSLQCSGAEGGRAVAVVLKSQASCVVRGVQKKMLVGTGW